MLTGSPSPRARPRRRGRNLVPFCARAAGRWGAARGDSRRDGGGIDSAVDRHPRRGRASCAAARAALRRPGFRFDRSYHGVKPARHALRAARADAAFFGRSSRRRAVRSRVSAPGRASRGAETAAPELRGGRPGPGRARPRAAHADQHREHRLLPDDGDPRPPGPRLRRPRYRGGPAGGGGERDVCAHRLARAGAARQAAPVRGRGTLAHRRRRRRRHQARVVHGCSMPPATLRTPGSTVFACVVARTVASHRHGGPIRQPSVGRPQQRLEVRSMALLTAVQGPLRRDDLRGLAAVAPWRRSGSTA